MPIRYIAPIASDPGASASLSSTLTKGADRVSVNDKVLNVETAFYRYLELLRAGAKMTVYTKNSGSVRTNVVAVLKKEDGWGDWKVVSRPATANPALLPETFGEKHPGIISARTIADTFESDRELWATVKE